MITVEAMQVGSIQTNCYLIVNEETKEAILFDPGDEEERILKTINEKNVKLTAIYLTHGHFDHILAATAVAKATGVKIYCSDREGELVSNQDRNLSAVFGWPFTLVPDGYVKDQQEIELLGTKMKVLFTPGHTPGSVCYYFASEGLLFSGDTIFYESYGRCDFPGGDETAICVSVAGVLASLPEDVVIYPGHGCATTILNERLHNPASVAAQ